MSRRPVVHFFEPPAQESEREWSFLYVRPFCTPADVWGWTLWYHCSCSSNWNSVTCKRCIVKRDRLMERVSFALQNGGELICWFRKRDCATLA